MKTLLLTAGVLAAAALAAPPLDGRGQSVSPEQAAPARFEVASVKRNSSGETFMTFNNQPNRLVLTNVAVRQLIVRAYQVQPFQVTGGPAWLASDRFDINATALETATPAQMNAMLQTLLAERFKLVLHRENRPGDVFHLVKARPDGKLGEGLKAAAIDCAAFRGRGPGGPAPGPGGPSRAPGGLGRAAGPGTGTVAVPAPGPGGAPGGCFMMIGPGRLELSGQPLSTLANALAQQLGRPVRDETGLGGAYDLTLTFMPDSTGRGMPIGPPPPGAPELPPIDPNAPSLTTALAEQLGLKLEAARGPMEMIVIDRIEQPTED